MNVYLVHGRGDHGRQNFLTLHEAQRYAVELLEALDDDPYRGPPAWTMFTVGGRRTTWHVRRWRYDDERAFHRTHVWVQEVNLDEL